MSDAKYIGHKIHLTHKTLLLFMDNNCSVLAQVSYSSGCWELERRRKVV